MDAMTIYIDGDVNIVEKYSNEPYGDYELHRVELDDGTEWYLFESSEVAGKTAKIYWKELAETDPDEFAAIVGEKTLVAWALGQYAGPGSVQVSSLDEWLDLWLDIPEEQWAGYDGIERDARVSHSLQEESGLPNKVVAYRLN